VLVKGKGKGKKR